MVMIDTVSKCQAAEQVFEITQCLAGGQVFAITPFPAVETLLQAPRHGIHKYSSQLKVFLPDTE